MFLVVSIVSQLPELNLHTACTTLLFVPWVAILDGAGVEIAEWPPAHCIKLIVLNIALDLAFNFSILLLIAVTSPVLAAVATVLTIPASVMADYLFKGVHLSALNGVGVALISLGFLFLVFSHAKENRENQTKRKRLQLQLQASD